MSYLHQSIGQDVSMPSSGDVSVAPDGTVYSQDVVTGDYTIVLPDGTIFFVPAISSSYQVPSPSPADTGGSWLTSLKDIVGSVASVAAPVLKALTTQTGAVPAGYRYDPVTGRIVSTATGLPLTSPGIFSAMPTWLLPVGVGLGAFVLLRKK